MSSLHFQAYLSVSTRHIDQNLLSDAYLSIPPQKQLGSALYEHVHSAMELRRLVLCKIKVRRWPSRIALNINRSKLDTPFRALASHRVVSRTGVHIGIGIGIELPQLGRAMMRRVIIVCHITLSGQNEVTSFPKSSQVIHRDVSRSNYNLCMVVSCTRRNHTPEARSSASSESEGIRLDAWSKRSKRCVSHSSRSHQKSRYS